MSDRDSWNDPQPEAPLPAPKKKMSGCMLAALIGGGLFLVGMVACCGGGAWVVSLMVPTISKEPADVAAVGRQILNTEMLEDFSPDNAMTIDNMLFTMRIAEFRHKEGKGEMMIGSIKIKMGDPKQMGAQSQGIRQGFEAKGRETLDMKKTETHEIKINGQKVIVSIGEATERSTGKIVHTADAEFNQPVGQTFVILRMDDEIWDQDAVLKMLEEIKPGDGKVENPKLKVENPDEAKPAETTPEDAKPDEAKPEEAKPEETKTP